MPNVTTLLDVKSVPAAKAGLICPPRNETYSFGKLRSEMNRIGLVLSGLGVKKGDRVCFYLDRSPEYLISYFAIWRIGAIAVPTNIFYRGEELLHAINDAGASAIITDGQGATIVTLSVVTPQHFHISSAQIARATDRLLGNRFPRHLQPFGQSTALLKISAISSIPQGQRENPKGPFSRTATG
jgi:acyl-CoA synthetase (AMP-forming)/AMP-acid ligase II